MAERARLGWVIVYVPAVEDAIAIYERAFAHALEAGRTARRARRRTQSHGQVVGRARDPWGTLIEVCSPIG